MFKLIAVAMILMASVSCSMTENGLVFGTPDYEKRSVLSSPNDLEILVKANSYLQYSSEWNREVIKACSDSKKLNLYCALEAASIDVLGKYVHRKAALQEVRFAIDDKFRDRWSKHRLIDFNNHPDTTFYDVKNVIDMAINSVQKKLDSQEVR
ncbi:MAG: hypothetical protein OEM38_01730 [Gammaproteobacteria bacterium]|nr:hypothetical protein [Gammaproteobacteria bacterium]